MESGPQRPGLSVSVVTYAPDIGVLKRTLSSLDEALLRARSESLLGAVTVFLVDNGPGSDWASTLRTVAEETLRLPDAGGLEIISGHGNIGYGRGHNLAISSSTADYHLVLNPDVILDCRAIAESLRFMAFHHDVGLLTPAAVGADGRRQYLCKRYPAVFDLLIRGFAPRWLSKMFHGRLAVYEMRHETQNSLTFDVPIVSGSFMFLRRRPLNDVGGFSGAYFMYFEDFDLSLRLSTVARIAYVPSVRIVHLGGEAARKGFRHICLFVRSSIRFYGDHGWKWY